MSSFKEIEDNMDNFKNGTAVAMIFTIDDIKKEASHEDKEITDEQCVEVLELINEDYDNGEVWSQMTSIIESILEEIDEGELY